MTEEFLNGVQIKAFSDEVGSVAMAQAMSGHVFMDVARLGNSFDGPLNGLAAHGFFGSSPKELIGTGRKY